MKQFKPLFRKRDGGFLSLKVSVLAYKAVAVSRSRISRKVVGDPGIEPGVRLREGVTVPCHTLRPVAHWRGDYLRPQGASTFKSA